MTEEVKFRKMTIADIDDVYEIEHSSFSLPWTKEAFFYEMLDNQHSYYVLAETADGIVGFLWALDYNG